MLAHSAFAARYSLSDSQARSKSESETIQSSATRVLPAEFHDPERRACQLRALGVCAPAEKVRFTGPPPLKSETYLTKQAFHSWDFAQLVNGSAVGPAVSVIENRWHDESDAGFGPTCVRFSFRYNASELMLPRERAASH